MLLLFWSALASPPPTCLLLHASPSGETTLSRVALSDGERSPVLSLGDLDISSSRGLVVRDGTALVCAAGEIVATGSEETRPLGTACAAVGGGASVVVTDPAGRPAALHADIADVTSEIPAGSEAHLHRLGAVAATLEAVVVASLPGAALHWTVPDTGAVERTVVPEGAIGPIWGLSIVDDTLVLLDDGRVEDTSRGPTVRWYELDSMAPLGSVALSLEPGEYARGLDRTP